MKFYPGYRGHKFIKQKESMNSHYTCSECKMFYYAAGNYYSIGWSEQEWGMFNEDNVLTCSEVQIKRLLE
jgi:hypothetical protein